MADATIEDDQARALRHGGHPDALSGFEATYARHHKALHGLFRQRGADPEMAEELAQRTWTVCWEAIERGRYDPGRAKLTTFVYAIAARVWLKRFRGRRPTVPDWPEGPDGGVAPEQALQHAELLEALRACLRGGGGPHALSAEERRVVTAASDGESERQLAERLGIAASTVNARKRSGLAKLRRCLTGKGFTPDMVEQLVDRAE